MSRPDAKPRYASELRDAIDRGDAGDKSAQGDPSAAPLGTDDEAAGTPNSTGQVERALEQEVAARPPDRGENATATIPVAGSVQAYSRKVPLERIAPWLVMAGGVALVLLVFFAMRAFGLVT